MNEQNQASDTQVPEGYWRDARGLLHHESLVKPLDKERDELVRKLMTQAKELQAAMLKFKQLAFDEIHAFVELSALEYGARYGGIKGNVSLTSFDGRLGIQLAIQESINFDERLHAAKTLIDECLLEWSEGARPELMTIVNDAFRADQSGNIRTARVLALRRHDIQDARWQAAMQAIGEACQVVGSKAYVRFYERAGNDLHMKAISLDIAKL